MEISTEAEKGLRGLVESMRWRFEDVLTNAWSQGEPIFLQPLKMF
jgi:exocyst complex component 2